MSQLKESLLTDGGASNYAQMQQWRKRIFMITFVNYAMSHVARKCYTNVKTDLVDAGVASACAGLPSYSMGSPYASVGTERLELSELSGDSDMMPNAQWIVFLKGRGRRERPRYHVLTRSGEMP